MALTAEQKQQIVSDNRRHDGDDGGTEVQVALLTQKINRLTDHMRANRHDYHSRRGLLRNRLLRYLARTGRERYLALIQKLGLRK